MSDRELLELAARAIGLQYHSYVEHELIGRGLNIGDLETPIWNPLDYDGDSLRLAVRLGLRIDTPKHKGFGSSCGNQTVFLDGCPYAQTRRAIVLAAAAIGKEMK